MQTIEVTWGEAVSAKVYKFPGGLKRAVDAIIATVGPNVGTRNTFSKLMRVERTEDLSPVFQWRAWLLLTTLDIEPRLWGIGNEVVPPAFDPETLREALKCATRDSNPQPSDPKVEFSLEKTRSSQLGWISTQDESHGSVIELFPAPEAA